MNIRCKKQRSILDFVNSGSFTRIKTVCAKITNLEYGDTDVAFFPDHGVVLIIAVVSVPQLA